LTQLLNRFMLFLGAAFLAMTAAMILLPRYFYAIVISDTVTVVLLIFLYLVKPDVEDEKTQESGQGD
jgi:multisubunit Na+/H+ antiporter MnhF subunit